MVRSKRWTFRSKRLESTSAADQPSTAAADAAAALFSVQPAVAELAERTAAAAADSPATKANGLYAIPATLLAASAAGQTSFGASPILR